MVQSERTKERESERARERESESARVRERQRAYDLSKGTTHGRIGSVADFYVRGTTPVYLLRVAEKNARTYWPARAYLNLSISLSQFYNMIK